MTPEKQRIAIAEACGWAGVPCEQAWRHSTKERWWRTVTPEPIYAALKKDYCSSMMLARWLRKPDGTPFIMERQFAGQINNFDTFTDKPVIQGFCSSEWKEQAAYGWKFQTDTWPDVGPSLAPFVKYLPDYLNDLNAMAEAEKSLKGKKISNGGKADEVYFGYWLPHVCCCVEDEYNTDSKYYELNHVRATATQRAEAFLRTLNLWTE